MTACNISAFLVRPLLATVTFYPSESDNFAHAINTLQSKAKRA